MSVELLALCAKPKVAMRDGWTGATAHILLPFYTNGYWFADGREAHFPNSTVAQNTSRTLFGTSKPDTFIKAPGICLG